MERSVERHEDSSAESVTRSLEARYYTDPRIFEAERAGVLSRTWQFAGHSSRIKNIGDYFTFETAGESLFQSATKADKSAPIITFASTAPMNWSGEKAIAS